MAIKSESTSYIPESGSSQSLMSNQEEIKENRKFISYIFRSLVQKKNHMYSSLVRLCIEILKTYKRDITKLVDEEKNSGNFALI